MTGVIVGVLKTAVTDFSSCYHSSVSVETEIPVYASFSIFFFVPDIKLHTPIKEINKHNH